MAMMDWGLDNQQLVKSMLSRDTAMRQQIRTEPKAHHCVMRLIDGDGVRLYD
jgi:hypothetical protein